MIAPEREIQSITKGIAPALRVISDRCAEKWEYRLTHH